MALSRSRGPLVATRWRNDRATKELERARPAYFVGGTVTANRPWMQRLFVVALFAMAACGGRTSGSEANVDPASGVLTKTTFRLPEDGGPATFERGPFCCSGKTVVVELADGRPVGYAYFYSWKGDALDLGYTSVAPDVSVLVAAVPSLAQPGRDLQHATIDFAASELEPGFSRTTTAGAMKFVVTIDHLDAVNVSGAAYFDMLTLTAHLDVEPLH